MRANCCRDRRMGLLALLILAGVAVTVPCRAETVVVRIEATNPGNEAQDVPIRGVLPPGIAPDDILATAGLDVGYDVTDEVYFVHGVVVLPGGAQRQLDVELRDIWLLDTADLDMLEEAREVTRGPA